MSRVYLVLKEGVYVQGVVGVCSSHLEAKNLAIKTANNDKDGYHTYDVYCFEVDVVPAGRPDCLDSYRKELQK